MPVLHPSLPSVRVIVRGWLNCNHVLLLDDAGHVLIDSGYSSGTGEMLVRLAAPDALGARPLARVINTHCHADHMGGNAALVRRYGCAVTVPASAAADVRPWNRGANLLDYAGHEVEPFDYTDTLAPGDSFSAGGLEWRALAAPGHDANALVYWCEAEGLVVSGDALWENGLGAIFPVPTLESAVAAAHATLDRIAAAAPRRVVPGHGLPFSDVAGAIARARTRLDAFAADPRKNARHVMKSVLAFALLAHGRMRAAEVADYCARVPCYVDLNARFIGGPLARVIEELLVDMGKAGILAFENGWVRPTIPA